MKKREKNRNKKETIHYPAPVTAIFVYTIVNIVVVASLVAFDHFPNIQFAAAQPSITKDPNLKVSSIVSGLSSPTSMAFIGSHNILVLEKDGNVRLVSNGNLQQQPLLHLPVDTESERGLLGIAVTNDSKSIFLYYTSSQGGGGELSNRVYRYELKGQELVNAKLLMDLPALPGPNHDGGKLVIGPDNYLYTVIGDLNHRGKVQNLQAGHDPDYTGGILKINPNDGSAARNNPFLANPNVVLHKYFAYGVRNSFGLAFDPITGSLWDTENGPSSYDEVNLVRPGFNSGWIKTMGPIAANQGVTEQQLVDFPGSHYADPAFSWKDPVAVTDLEFFKSSKLGPKYQNNLFVGDYNNGNLYYFKVNRDRTGIELDTAQQSSGLSDLVVDNNQELSEVIFGTGFNSISDIKTGPDGLLYVLSFGDGKIYTIGPV